MVRRKLRAGTSSLPGGRLKRKKRAGTSSLPGGRLRKVRAGTSYLGGTSHLPGGSSFLGGTLTSHSKQQIYQGRRSTYYPGLDRSRRREIDHRGRVASKRGDHI